VSNTSPHFSMCYHYMYMQEGSDFAQHKIKEYSYWSVFVHSNQGYLGRCIVWCNREDALDLTDATTEERNELFVVLHDIREAVTNAFNADWFNYAFLGNTTRHLHGHIIPRYASEQEFGGMIFKDERWGHNYRTDHDFVTPNDVLEKIKIEIQKNIAHA